MAIEGKSILSRKTADFCVIVWVLRVCMQMLLKFGGIVEIYLLVEKIIQTIKSV